MGCASSAPPQAFPSQLATRSSTISTRSSTHSGNIAALPVKRATSDTSVGSTATLSTKDGTSSEASVDSWQSALRFSDRSQSDKASAKLVIFDFDETLTLATFLPKNPLQLTEEKLRRSVEVSFQPSWMEESRIQRLDAMLTALSTGPDGERRALAVLTKNSAGLRPIVKMLEAAGLDHHFSALWSMPVSAEDAGAFRGTDGTWQFFRPAVDMVPEEKADIIHSISEHPEQWFPQLSAGAAAPFSELCFDNIVLVDDSAKNFVSSTTGRKVARCVEVSRFSAEFHGKKSMTLGGIGAKSDGDYEALQAFVNAPWLYRE